MQGKYLTLKEAAERKRVSYKTIFEWVRYGFGKKKIRLSAVRHGKRLFVNEHTLDSFQSKISEAYEVNGSWQYDRGDSCEMNRGKGR